MKLVYFDDFRLGVLKGDAVVDVSPVVRDIPHTGPHDLISGLIERFAEYRKRLETAAAQGQGVPLANVRLRPPLPRPVTIDCMAVNYLEDGTLKEPAPINAFHKSPSAIIGPEDTMVLPDVPATIFEGEAELAVVIGKRASHVGAADAMSHVFGYVNFIDGSARGLPPSGNTFFQMKSRDTFAPIGPCLVTADEIADPQRLQIRLWVNGTLKQNFNTSDMAHKIPRCIEWLTSIHTLEPATSSPPAPTIAGSAPSRTAMSSSSRPGAGPAALPCARRAEAELVARHAAGPAEPGLRYANAANRRQIRPRRLKESKAGASPQTPPRGAAPWNPAKGGAGPSPPPTLTDGSSERGCLW